MESPDTQAPLGGLVQIGIVVPDVDRALEACGRLLRLTEWNINFVDTQTGKGRKFHKQGRALEAKAKIAWARLGIIEFELIEPQDECNVYSEYLATHGPGVHHIMLDTANYDESAERLGGMNVEMIAGGELDGTRFQRFDTQKLLGFIYEIADGEPLTPDQTVSTRNTQT